jgi:hypothetical protein
MLSGDKEANHQQRLQIEKHLYSPSNWSRQVREFYYKTSYQLMKSNSIELQEGRFQLDMVKQYANSFLRSMILPCTD